jgi:hypothetical protein
VVIRRSVIDRESVFIFGSPAFLLAGEYTPGFWR